MPTETPRQRLQELLRELFQFDCADLDFGIYRIMNFRRKELERFVQKVLLKSKSEWHTPTEAETNNILFFENPNYLQKIVS